MTYRPEIDGLRAIAVLAVVLFHAGMDWLPGGYVGVDVFFVISGYLITSIIWRECREERFSLVHFWERRARRIMPAVTVVVLVTLLAGWFLLLPRDFKALGQSSVAQATMLSNFYFWHMSGYFDQASELKPLLHTWSLAVEEQFYLIFPIGLYFVRRKSKAFIAGLFGTVFLVSLALGVWQTHNYPDSAFYLLPARMWELMVGALLALAMGRRQLPGGPRFRSAVSFAGLAMIAYAVFCYSSSTRFPGGAALLPCAGSALVISGGGGHRVAGLLSTKPMVGIGLVSYSWYLWHWPMFAFLNYWIHDPSLALRWGVVVMSLAFAWISWRWVEQPFRKKGNGLSRSGVFAMAAVCTVLMTGLGLALHWKQGVRDRFSKEVLRYSDSTEEKSPDRGLLRQESWQGEPKDLNRIEGGAPQLCLIGDSFMESVMHQFREAAVAKSVYCVGVTKPAGLALSTKNSREREERKKIFQGAIEWIVRHDVSHVVMLYRWSSVNSAYEEKVLRDALERLTNAGVKVTAIVGLPGYNVEIPRELAKYEITNGRMGHLPRMKLTDVIEAEKDARRVLASYENEGLDIIDALPLLTDEEGYTILQVGRKSLYYDYTHLSIYGTELIQDLINRAVK